MNDSPQTREQYSTHMPALHLLCNLGWRFLPRRECLALRGSTRDVLLKPRLVDVLKTRRFVYKGVGYPLSTNAIEQIVREVATLSMADGLVAANERLYGKLALGITVTEFMPDGKKHQPTIALIDWTNPANNVWDVTEELDVLSTSGTHTRTPDIVGYVNGIPLVVIEAKKPVGAHGDDPSRAIIHEGISQHLRNQRPDEIPSLFGYAQLLIAVSHTDARYGTTELPSRFWSNWKDEEFDEAHCLAIKNRALPPATRAALFDGKPAGFDAYFDALWAKSMLVCEQDRLLIGLLTPSRLLEFLRSFVLFDRKVGKIVARYPQFFGIRVLLARLRGFEPDGARQGGVIWHTTGSGKSFTMVFLTKALLLYEALRECRVVVVTDRIDLENQLAGNFVSGGAFGSSIATTKEGEKSKVATGRQLAKRIGKGTERILFTLVQKFTTASKLPECRNDSRDLIVLVDEGHRSHGGETHERMRRALPRAAYVAFTGTPLLKKDKTTNKFGPIVHAYNMQRAVDDGTVAPLLYEERVPELDINQTAVDRWFDRITQGMSEQQRSDLKKKYANKGTIYGATNRIELIAWDIATHYAEHVRPLGLKGQVATDSKQNAVRYKRALDETGLVASAVIISPPDTREGNTDVDESDVPDVQKWWKETIEQRWRKDVEEYEKRMLDGFAGDDEPELLIVVDRLLTGFDEPRNGVLYIDKPLDGHNLIQAVARVNRLHDAKRFGLLVDYRGILPALDTAVRAYQDLQNRTQGGYDVADIENLYRAVSTEYTRLPMLHDHLWSFFTGINERDFEAFRRVLSPRFVANPDGDYDANQKRREDFYAAVTEFALCLQVALSSRGFYDDKRFSEERVMRYKRDLAWFSNLRQIARRDAMETIDYGKYEDQIRKLVDRQVIGKGVRDAQGVYLVHELGRDLDAVTWSPEKTRNETDLIRTRLRKTIEQDLANDPYAQKVFGEMLKEAIAAAEALFDHPLKQYALMKAFEYRVAQRSAPGVPSSLGENHRAKSYYGALLIGLGIDDATTLDAATQDVYAKQALRIDRVVVDSAAEHSLNPQNFESAVRNVLLNELFGAYGLDRTRLIVDQVVQIARHGGARP